MLVLVAILAIFPLYTRLKVVAAPVPPGVTLGGLQLSDLKQSQEIAEHLREAYSGPIAIRFGDKRLALRPEEVGFYLDVDQMIAEARSYLSGPQFFDIAWRYALGFDQQQRNVPARYMVDTEKLRAWLEEVAREDNTQPQGARAIAPLQRFADGTEQIDGLPDGYTGFYESDWEWVTGAPGLELNVDKSIPLIVEALASADKRSTDLAVDVIEPPLPSMADLQRIIDNQTMQFPGFASVYVHDLTHGDEAIVDGDVSFSGMSTLKIGIATAVMAKLKNGVEKDDPVSFKVGQWLDYGLGESNNYAANLLLRWLGDGSVDAGTRHFTEFMHGLGFDSTYMQSGYDLEVQLPQVATPGNQQTEWNTDPDSNLQSTAEDMGRILSAIYQCTQGTGILIERHPDEITPDECWQILFYMTHDTFEEMVWGGLPDLHKRWIVHKHGFAFESHSDVALIWGPNGPYVVSIFLFRDGWMDWATSNSTMEKISRIAWRFFEFQQAQEEKAAVPAPVLKPPPGYVVINDVIPAPDN